MVYEAVVLFGVLFAAELLFAVVTQNLDAQALDNWRHLYLFVTLGAYFTYFWGHGGQTLPMQTWHIRVTSADNRPVSFKQASIRYCAAWMWFLPAFVIISVAGLQRWPSLILLFVGMCVWALASKLDPNGQFLHDRLAGTHLIAVPKKPRVGDTE